MMTFSSNKRIDRIHVTRGKDSDKGSHLKNNALNPFYSIWPTLKIHEI